MYFKLIEHSTILYIVPFGQSFLGHGKLDQFGGSGTQTSANTRVVPKVMSNNFL